MQRLCFLILLGFIGFSCEMRSVQNQKESATLYPLPTSLPLNLNKGYTRHATNGDSLKPIITHTGEPLITGRPLLLKPKVLNIKPKVLASPTIGSEKPLYTNQWVLGKPIIHRIKPKTYSLKSRRIAAKNLPGETIPIETPLLLRGKKKLLTIAPSLPIGTPRYQDNALYDMQNFGPQQGLYSSIVYDICQSKRGGLWLATYKGLSYYDGNTFTHYTPKEGLPFANVRSVLEDSQGNVWFSLKARGLCKYDGDTLTFFTDHHGLLNNHVNQIKEDKQGNIWWVSFYGLTKFDGKYVTHYSLGKARYTRLHIDSKGTIWVSSSHEIVKFDEQKLLVFELKGKLPPSDAVIMSEDRAGNMWFGLHRGGLLKYDGQVFSQYTHEQGLPCNAVFSITNGKDNNLWLGTDKGLIKHTGGKLTLYTTKEGLASDFILKIFEDNQQNLWLGTFRTGLIRYKLNTFVHQDLQKDRTDDIPQAFCVGEQKSMWIATHSSGLIKLTDSTMQMLSHDNPHSINIPYAIVKDAQHNIWVGETGGVVKYTATQRLFYPIVDKDDAVKALLCDHNNHIWMESKGGIVKYDGKQFIEYPFSYSPFIWKIIKDRRGNIWIATEQGVCKLVGNYLTVYTPKEGLSGSFITDLIEDKRGNIWMATLYQGAMKLEDNMLTYYTVKEGLPSNLVKSIMEDHMGNIWLGTDQGLSFLRFSTSSGVQTPGFFKINSYDQSDGLKAVDFEFGSAHADHANNLWWGTNKGVVKLNVNTFQVPQKAPQVQLKQLEINGHFFDFRTLADSLKKSITFQKVPKYSNLPTNPTLDHHHKHIKLHFSAVGEENPQKVWYSYRIKGVEKSWHKPTKQLFAEYKNLPYSAHTFQIKAIGRAHVWSKIVEYTFSIRPPWWKSTWAIVLYILGGLFLVFSYIKWRLSYLVRKKQLLEKSVLERTLELNKAVEQLNNLNIDLQHSKAEVIRLKEKEKAVLRNQIKERESELLLTLKMTNEKRNKIALIRDKLFDLIKRDVNQNSVVISAARDLDQLFKSINDLEVLMQRIETKYPGISIKIKARYPEFSSNDVKHCLFIKLNLSLKEVASTLNVSVHAVKMARQRIKKKMVIPKNVTLKDFIDATF